MSVIIFNNAVKDNFLSKDELVLLTNLIKEDIASKPVGNFELNGQGLDSEYLGSHAIITEDMGRITVRDFQFPKELQRKFSNYAREITQDPSLTMTGYAFAEYNLKYGTPSLKPHVDAGDPNFLLDFHVYGDVEWPLIINGEEKITKTNTVACLYNTAQIHWRNPRKFKEGENIGMLFLNFYSSALKKELKHHEVPVKKVEEKRIWWDSINV